MMGRQKRIALVLILVLIVTASMIWAAWDFLGMWIAPKLILHHALKEAIQELDVRFQDHPAMVLQSLSKAEGRYFAEVELSFPEATSGVSRYNGTAQLDLNKHQIRTQGDLSTGRDTYGFSVYLDREIAAVQSDKMSSDDFFAISYDTFSEEIQMVPLISLFLKTSLFSGWEKGLHTIKNVMDQNIPIPNGMQVTPEMMDGFLKGILVLPCRVERSDCWLDSRFSSCKISYSLDPKTVQILERGGVSLDRDLEKAEVSFILYRNNLVQVYAEAESADSTQRCTLMLMEDGAAGKAGITYSGSNKETEDTFSLGISSNRGKSGLSEYWELEWRLGGQHKSVSLSCVGTNGRECIVRVQSEDQNVALTLKKADEGITVSSPDLGGLITMFVPEKRRSVSDPVACTVTLRKGEAVPKPAYKPMKDWSLEEFAEMLTVLAPVFGWKI